MSALGVRFTSGVIPADHLVANMAAKPFRSMYLRMYKLWWGSSPGSSTRVPYSMWYDRRSTDQCRIVLMVTLKLVYKISLRNVHLINKFAPCRTTTSSDFRYVSEDILRLQKKRDSSKQIIKTNYSCSVAKNWLPLSASKGVPWNAMPKLRTKSKSHSSCGWMFWKYIQGYEDWCRVTSFGEKLKLFYTRIGVVNIWRRNEEFKLDWNIANYWTSSGHGEKKT